MESGVLADQIMSLPLRIEINIGTVKYLLAHAMTFAPLYGEQEETMYLEGIAEMKKVLAVWYKRLCFVNRTS